MVGEGEVSPGHARALLAFDDQDRIVEIAQKVKTGKYSVRDIERMAKNQDEKKEKAAKAPEEPAWGGKSAFLTEMEIAMSMEMGRKVRIIPNGEGEKGKAGAVREVESVQLMGRRPWEDETGMMLRLFDCWG